MTQLESKEPVQLNDQNERSHQVNTLSLLMEAAHTLAPWVTQGLRLFWQKLDETLKKIEHGTNSTW